MIQSQARLLNQKGLVIWMTGLSGSGKTTIADATQEMLLQKGYYSIRLDGDELRTGLCNDLGFSDNDRKENIRRSAELARILCINGAIVICSFISPTLEIRKMAQAIIGPTYYHEVYINTSIEICEKRDVKGLYEKARRGYISDFTGISAPFDEPQDPNLILDTANFSPTVCANTLFKYIQNNQA